MHVILLPVSHHTKRRDSDSVTPHRQCYNAPSSPLPPAPQSYVVNKLMRYLRWSNLIRKHFPIADLESVNGYDSAGEYGDYSPSNGRANGNGHKHMNGDANGFATAGNNGAGGEGEGEDDERAQGRAPKTHRYTFSDRGDLHYRTHKIQDTRYAIVFAIMHERVSISTCTWIYSYTAVWSFW